MRPLLHINPARCRRANRPSRWTLACAVLLQLLAATSGAEETDRKLLRRAIHPAAQPEPWREPARPLIPQSQADSSESFRVHEPAELLSEADATFFAASESGVQLASWEAPPEPPDAVATDDAIATETASVAETEPLSRLEWPEPDGSVDAGATLRGLAEGAGLVLALCVVGLWGLRHWLVKRNQPAGSGQNLRRIDSLALPQRCQVHLLDVQGQRVLVAMDAGGLKGVTVLPDSFESLVELQEQREAVAAPARPVAAIAGTPFA